MTGDDQTAKQAFSLRMGMLILSGMLIMVLSAVAVLLIWRGLSVDQISTTLATITTTLGGIATTVLMLMRLQGSTDQQTQLLSKIDDQTNGILTQKIQDVIGAELDRRAVATTAVFPIVTEAPEGTIGQGIQQTFQ